MSDFQQDPYRPVWPEQQRPDTTDAQQERWELPVSNPAELAGYAADADPGETNTEEQSFVDLGFASEQAHAAQGDEFGSFGADDDIQLDAA